MMEHMSKIVGYLYLKDEHERIKRGEPMLECHPMYDDMVSIKAEMIKQLETKE